MPTDAEPTATRPIDPTAQPATGPSTRTPPPADGPPPVSLGAATSAATTAMPWWRPEVAQWLVERRNAGDTPAEITTELVARGWDADTAADTARRSLRRSDHHRALYGTLCWSMGLGSLGLATGLHQVLAETPDPELAAIAFTLAVVLLPLGGWCGWTAKQLESTSSHAVWSPTRRMWFGTLASLTAVIGMVRLITYVYLMIASLTGARHTPLTPEDQLQVLVSLGVVVPLFAWSFGEWRRSDVVISGLRDVDRRAERRAEAPIAETHR